MLPSLTIASSARMDDLVEFNKLLAAKLLEMVPPEQQRVEEKVVKLGGMAVVRRRDDLLRKLLSDTPIEQSDVATVDEGRGKGTQAPPDRDGKLLTKDVHKPAYHNSLGELKRELREGWDEAVKRNWRKFESKIEDLKVHVSTVIHEEHDRLIKAMNEGPHEQIEHEVNV